MASDYFLKIDDIDGESTDPKHRGEIEIESYSWGVSNPGRPGFGNGAGAGKALLQDFHFVKKLDKASAKLFSSCVAGEHIKEATLTARRTIDEKSTDWIVVTMKGCAISSYQQEADGDRPKDTFTVSAARIQFDPATEPPDPSIETTESP